MQAINTYYKDHLFRSRLEARWAVFFDNIGVRYEYEPEGYVLEDGTWYLPDFYLPDVTIRKWVDKNLEKYDEQKDQSYFRGVYIEIKRLGSKVTELKGFTKPIVIFHGDPMNNIWNTNECNEGGFQTGINSWDHCMRFWKCGQCTKTKIEFAESNYDDNDTCERLECKASRWELSNAAAEARTYRF